MLAFEHLNLEILPDNDHRELRLAERRSSLHALVRSPLRKMASSNDGPTFHQFRELQREIQLKI